MGYQIRTGTMILNLIKPMEYRTYELFVVIGFVVAPFFMVLLPTFVIVSVITGWAIPLGLNLVLFFPALLFALLVSYYIDFFVGTICLYTESTWGINTAKEVVVLLLSGAVIPLAFFPEGLRRVMEYLPFRAIFDIPLQILMGRTTGWSQVLSMYGVQLIWIVVMYILGGLFWKKSIKIITINGG